MRQPIEAIKQYLTRFGGDGHTLLYASTVLDMGFTQEFVDRFTRDYASDGTGKGSIWKNGEIVEEAKGVYCLPFAYGIADDIGADTEEAGRKMGRGFQAQELAKAIQTKLEELESVAA